MGFPIGPEDRPFSERFLGLGRQLAPTAAGRHGCVLMLVAGFVILTAAVAAAVIFGTL